MKKDQVVTFDRIHYHHCKTCGRRWRCQPYDLGGCSDPDRCQKCISKFCLSNNIVQTEIERIREAGKSKDKPTMGVYDQ